MKAINYVKRMVENGTCSIHEVEKLNEALHREKLLEDNIIIRFKPLFAEFDLVSADWFSSDGKKCHFYTKIGNIDKLVIFIKNLYTENKMHSNFA